MHLQKVSAHVSLRGLRRLTCVETFGVQSIFWMSNDYITCRSVLLLDKMDVYGFIIFVCLFPFIYRRYRLPI